ncbi:acyl CoA:acetate/3-ketoacid CoA transferase [Pseudonocardia sp. CA-107938]|uniref:acyl CoA:acetate/3-ketoacid CoA transferase n=1 Tax=Pseudonocardia sp. CA-107938 TaxID=3240021 RepID=UPI003D8F6DB0
MVTICDPAQAAARVPDGATVLVDGSGGGVNEPGAVLAALEARFLEQAAPAGLTLVHISGMGDGHGGGIDRFSHPGMVRRVIGGHWGWTPGMQALAVSGEIEAYCLPQGTLSHLMREIAGGRPGTVSQVGLGTFVDPRHGGGKLNSAATDDLVDVIELAGREWLFTKAFPIDVAIIRGTRADTDGNITMDGEGLLAETLSAAQAARASGGIVIAQVRELVAAGTLDPRRVRVPGVVVDTLVVAPDQRLSFATRDDPFLTGELRAPSVSHTPLALSVRKVIARRAALELHRGDVINLGFGVPDGVAAVLAEEGLQEQVTFTVEQGHVGGIPAGGSDFGMCVNPMASLDAGHQFDWYDGGGLDIAVLSFAQIDPSGNVNVSQFGGRIAGVGGFINISQGAKRLVFVGTFVAGAPVTVGGELPLQVPEHGAAKLVTHVEQVSFSAARALETGRPVVYVTERAVFRLTPDGIELTEIAPGLDLDADVLAHMEFKPLISPDLGEMDDRLYRAAAMSLELPTDDTKAR